MNKYIKIQFAVITSLFRFVNKLIPFGISEVRNNRQCTQAKKKTS